MLKYHEKGPWNYRQQKAVDITHPLSLSENLPCLADLSFHAPN